MGEEIRRALYLGRGPPSDVAMHCVAGVTTWFFNQGMDHSFQRSTEVNHWVWSTTWFINQGMVLQPSHDPT